MEAFAGVMVAILIVVGVAVAVIVYKLKKGGRDRSDDGLDPPHHENKYREDGSRNQVNQSNRYP